MSNDKHQIALYYTNSSLFVKASALAQVTNACVLLEVEPTDLSIYLRLDNNGLCIISNNFKPLYISEIYLGLVKRLKTLKDELLVKLIRSKSKKELVIWDLTAGLGKDAFIMASAGYNVLMVEQNPMLATILSYALGNKILPNNNLNFVNVI